MATAQSDNAAPSPTASKGRTRRSRPLPSLEWVYSSDKRPLEDEDDNTSMILSTECQAVLVAAQSPPRWMVAPTNIWRVRWELFMQVLIVFLAIVVPYELAFLSEYLMMEYTGWLVVEILMALVFLADMVLNFRTGILRHGKVDYDVRSVAWSYGTSWFPLDIIAWLPSALAIMLAPVESETEDGRSTAVARLGRSIKFTRVVRILRVLQIARVARLRNVVRGLHMKLLHTEAVSRALEKVGVAFLVFLSLHLMACLWGGVAPLEEYHLDNQGLSSDAPPASRYILALWWASCALTFGGQPDPRSDGERVLIVFTNLANVAVVCLVIAWSSGALSSISDKAELMDKLRVASRFSADNGLPKQLTMEVKQAIQHAQHTEKTAREFKEVVEGHLSHDLCQRVYGVVHGNLLRRFPPFSSKAGELFEGCSPVPDRFLSQLAYEANITVFMAGDRVASIGEKAETMVFILEGSLMLFGPGLPQPQVLREKYWFGEPVLIFDHVRGNGKGHFRWTSKSSTRAASIVALENCKLLEIGQESFKDAVDQHNLLKSWLLPIVDHVESRRGTLGCSCCRKLDHWVTQCPESHQNPQTRQYIARSEVKALSAAVGPRRPAWLPTSGPGNLNVPPEMWSMKLSQWAAFIMACCFTSQWGQLEESTDRKEAGYVNLYQLCEFMVKPWTQGTGNSVALLMNSEKPLKADVMISHAWGESILETLMAVLGKASVTGITLDTTVWFCTFAQYQCGDMPGDCGPTVEQQLALEPFKRVIESKPPLGMLVVHTSTAELYGRLWCVFEVNEAREADVRAVSAYSMGALKQLQDLDAVGSDVEAALAVDTSKASCWSESDAKMIREKITDGCGFEQLNTKILDFRLASVSVFRAMFNRFVDWAGSGDQEKAIFEGLTEVVDQAGVFVGLHCLAQYVEETQDSEMAVKLMARAKDILALWKGTFAAIGAVPPPCLDPCKVRQQPEPEDDAEVSACLLDLKRFPFATGLLEMAAGGSLPALLAQAAGLTPEDDKETSLQKLQRAFGEWTSNSAKMQKTDLARILRKLALDHLLQDLDVHFSAADANGDGLIDFLEFQTWLGAVVH